MKGSMTKVSIIVPVYNGEAYLGQSIRSALAQTLQEIEVICVDDGSTDSSSRIIQSLAAEDGRVIYLRQENQGAGVARNLGLQQAQGKYVCFLDADDYYINKDALQTMFDNCEEHGVSVCACTRMCVLNPDGHVYEHELFSKETADKVIDYRDCQTDYYYQTYLFQRKLLTEHDIFFPYYRRYQDPPFLVKAAYTAGRLLTLDICMYCYRASDASTRFNAQKTEDMLNGIIDNLLFAGQHNLDILFYNTAERLETAFVYVICEHISPKDLTILKLLLQANQLICEKYRKPDYVIKPLRVILFSMERYERELFHKIRSEKELALYGAGKITKAFLRCLKAKGLFDKTVNIVVSDLAGNPSQIEGIPVISLQDFLREKEAFLLVTVGRTFAEEIANGLQQNGYSHYAVLDDIYGDALLKKAKDETDEDNCHRTGL